MFKNTYQSGFISILFAGGSKPLSIWGEEVKNGHIRRVTDEDVQTLALEIMGTNVATTYIVSPPRKNDTLGIRLPFFIMIVKNMKKYFTFEITVLGSSYLETLRVQIHANVRIRRIYFSDRLYAEDEMPQEFKLYVPITSKKDKDKESKVAMEDKSTGADKVRVSIVTETQPEEKEEEPSGAPPTPTESDREAAGDVAEEPDAPQQDEPAPEEETEISEEPKEVVEEADEAGTIVDDEGGLTEEAAEPPAEEAKPPAEEAEAPVEEIAPSEPEEPPSDVEEPPSEEAPAPEPEPEPEPTE